MRTNGVSAELAIAVYKMLIGREPGCDAVIREIVATCDNCEQLIKSITESDEYSKYLLNKVSPVSGELVVAAYRVFLDRDPENEEVVAQKVQHFRSPEELLRGVLSSEEYARKAELRMLEAIQPYYHSSGSIIEVDVSNDDFNDIFSRIRDQWVQLGDSDPFWSVLSHEQYRMSRIEDTKKDFYESGAGTAALLDIFAQRTGVTVPDGTCVELGCGVGRVTHVLARRFQTVIGIDISDGNIALAREFLGSRDLNNVSWLLMRELAELDGLPDYDVLLSFIVLQHNPPPIIARLLRKLLGKLKPGGVFCFQVPTHTPGYSFQARSYLAATGVGENQFEMHAIPMSVVLDIVHTSGGLLKEVLLDNWTGMYGSHTFFGVKGV